MNDDKKEKMSELVAVRVTPTIKSELEAVAQTYDRPLSWVGRRILEKYINSARKAKL